MGARRAAPFAVALASALSCAPREVVDTSVGEVLVHVDTDTPVAFAARLHVDLYDARGVWYATRDVERARVEDWPASFGVHVTEAEREKVVTLRLRVYPERATRDYRGERYQARAAPAEGEAALAPLPSPPATGEPRLRDERGEDLTPRDEPQPLLAIDRLARIRVVQGRRVAARIVLRAVCTGTMVDLARGRTCLDQEGVLVDAPEEALLEDRSAPPSRVGSFDPRATCTVASRASSRAPDGTPLFDDDVCVPGAMFRFGTSDGVFGEADAMPERVAIVAPFLLDRHEVTVGRFRAALARGFVASTMPVVGEDPYPPAAFSALDLRACTFTAAPSGRETYPLSCVTASMARDFCRFEGGDLPSEVQWEYAAVAAERPYRTRFPWGGPDDIVPTCARAVWGRADRRFNGQLCAEQGLGPLPVDARMGEGGDVTPGLGIVGLGANLAELVRDAFAPFTAPCWASQGIHEPGCDVPVRRANALRGAAWQDNAAALVRGARRSEPEAAPGSGFRCMRPGRPAGTR